MIGIRLVNDLEMKNWSGDAIAERKVTGSAPQYYAHDPAECLIQRSQGLDSVSRRKQIERKSSPFSFGLGGQRIRNRRWRCKPDSKKEKENEVCRPQLCGPLGILFAVFNIDTVTETYNLSDAIDLSLDSIRPFVSLSTCYAAFGFGYITPESEWTEIAMNEVFFYGQKIFRDSLRSCETLESPKVQITKKCILCKNAMQLQLSAPIIIGTMQCQSSRTYSMTVGLEMFMLKYAHCICEIHNCFFLIWKRHNSYFLFDCYGRNSSYYREFSTGNAALICVCDVKSIGLILQHMSEFDSDAVYSLHAIQMTAMIPCCDQDFQTSVESRKADFRFLGSDHAVLGGNLHIAHESFRESLRKQCLTTALVATLYSKIDPACSWDASVLDKIHCKGDALYRGLSNSNAENSVAVQDIPANLAVGQFVVTIEIIPGVLDTTWTAIDTYTTNDALTAIRNLFENDRAKSLIIQVDKRTYAAWKRNNFYYIFDPYQRSIVNATVLGPEKHCTLHIMNSVAKLCATLNEYIMQAPTPSALHVHVVKVINIRKMNIKKLPAHESAMSSIVSSLGRGNLNTKDEYWRSGSEEPGNGRKEYIAKEVNQCFDREEVSSLNESVHDIECADRAGTQYGFYTTAEDELDAPIYSDQQTNQYDPNAIFEDSLPEAPVDIWSSLDGSQQSSTSVLEVNVDESSDPKADQASIKSKTSANTKERKKSGERKDEKSRVSRGRQKKESVTRKSKKHGLSANQKSSSHEETEDGGKSNRSKWRSENEKEGHEESESKKRDEKSKKTKRKNKIHKGNIRDNTGNRSTEEDRKKQDKNKTRRKYNHKEKNDKLKEKGKTQENDKKTHAGRNKSAKKKFTENLNDFEVYDSNYDTRDTDTYQEEEIWESDESLLKIKGENSYQTTVSQSRSSSDMDSHGTESKSFESVNSISSRIDRSNNYPGYRQIPMNMAVVGSESGSYKSLCNLISSGFKVTDRILVMTPWGNYSVFILRSRYFLFDGCTCNPERFRHLDLHKGTAGLLSCASMHELILRIMKGKQDVLPQRQNCVLNVDDICLEFCR